MPRRVLVHIDKHVHINEVTFEVYRSLQPTVNEKSPLLMKVVEPAAIKTVYQESVEPLVRDTDTPYAFLSKRHFEETPLPEVFVGDVQADERDLALFSDEKMIEIHNGDLGLGDGKRAYMSYSYQAIDVKDDYGPRSGVTYYGPPATGLRPPVEFELVANQETHKFEIRFQNNAAPIIYYYRIRAKDSDGNYSTFSPTQSAEVAPDPVELFFRIEQSPDKESWTSVAFSNQTTWFDEWRIAEPPDNVQRASVTPVGSKVSEIELDNPWFHWPSYVRHTPHYRIRAEDMDGESSEWVYIDPQAIYIQPKELLIRRKVDNGSPSSKTGTDAIDVFRLSKDEVDIAQPRLKLVDDQLSEALQYAYTFFYTDDADMEAPALMMISNHRPWANLIVLRDQKKTDIIWSADFETTFEWADRLIEIGADTGG